MMLEQEIAAWNGKSAEAIQAIYARYSQDDKFVSNLITLMAQPALHVGATWLLKRHLDVQKAPLDAVQTQRVYAQLFEFTHWEAQLHILQCMPYMPVAESAKTAVVAFLERCLTSEKKFVRAWAYNGFYELAVQYPRLQPQVTSLLKSGMQNEAASIKARIRNVMKQGFPE